MLNAAYDDVMDPSRVVIPISQEGSSLRCRVLIDGVYVGTADVPASLFKEGNERIGFVRREG